MASAGMPMTLLSSSLGGRPALLRRGGAGGAGGAAGVGGGEAATAAARARRPSLAATPTTRRSNSSVAGHVGAAVAAEAAPAPAAAAAAAATAVAGRPSFHNQQQQQQQQQRQLQRRRRRPDVSTAAKKRPGDEDKGDGNNKGGIPPSRGPGSSSSSSSPGDGQPSRPPPRGGAGGSERADKTKADFSAYWALRFREFFSKRRRYLDSANKPTKGVTDLPDISEKLFEIEELAGERQLEAEAALAELRAGGEAGLERRWEAKMAVVEQDAELETRAQEQSDRLFGWLRKKNKKRSGQQPEQRQQLKGAGGGGGADSQGAAAGPTRRLSGRLVTPAEAERMQARAALSYVSSPRVRVLHNAVGAAARLARAVATAPVSLPVALWRRWRAIFQGQSYVYFLDQEAMRMWYWRNRMENERWFWEIYFWDRMLVPTLWTLVYVAAAPANLLWCALIPLLMLAWRDGRMHGPGDWEWWLLMVFGVFGKCRGQIAELVRTAVSWGF